jgi:hypothetical protein
LKRQFWFADFRENLAKLFLLFTKKLTKSYENFRQNENRSKSGGKNKINAKINKCVNAFENDNLCEN